MAGGDSGLHDDVQQMIAAIQVQQSVELYNSVVEKAFRKCVHSFRSTSLTDTETKCIEDQTMRILRATQRAKVRIQEVQEQKQDELRERMQTAKDAKNISLPSY